MSLADRHLSHRMAAKYGTGGRLGWQSAQHVLRLLKGHNPSYPVYYDLEDAIVLNLSNSMKKQISTIFCNTVSAAGYEVGIYSNLDWWRNYLTDPIYDTWSRWVAQWNSTCSYTGDYDVWQCSANGKVDGISTMLTLHASYTKVLF